MSGTAIIVGASSSWARALVKISPYTFASIGIALSIGVSVLGAAWFESIFNLFNYFRVSMFIFYFNLFILFFFIGGFILQEVV